MTFKDTIALFQEDQPCMGTVGRHPPSSVDVASHPLCREHRIEVLSPEAVSHALAADKSAARIMAKDLAPAEGQLVGIRLSLNILKSQKIALQTIHAGNSSGGHRNNKGFYNGNVIGYAQAVSLSDAYMNVHQGGREKIASGLSSKYPMASIDGAFKSSHTPQGKVLEGVAIQLNPKREHLFCDSIGRPVRWAEEVIVIGHRAYAFGRIEYYTRETAPAKVGDAPSAVVF